MDRIDSLQDLIRKIEPDAPLSNNYLDSILQYQDLREQQEKQARAELIEPERGCVSKEDFVGEDLTLNRNVVIIINLEGREMALQCYRWSELRAIIEDPTTPESSKVHLWQESVIPSNRVYNLAGTWYSPQTEPLTRYYNTFVVRQSYDRAIGSSFGASQIHGEVYRLRVLSPIHRFLAREVVFGRIQKEELEQLIMDEFHPLPEDLVGPDSLITPNGTLYLADIYDHQPTGFGSIWKEDKKEQMGFIEEGKILSPVVAVSEEWVEEPHILAPQNRIIDNEMIITQEPYVIPDHIRMIRFNSIKHPVIPQNDNIRSIEIKNAEDIVIPSLRNLERLFINRVGTRYTLIFDGPLPSLEVLIISTYSIPILPESTTLDALLLMGCLIPEDVILPENYPLHTLFNNKTLKHTQVPYYPSLCSIFWGESNQHVPSIPEGTKFIPTQDVIDILKHILYGSYNCFNAPLLLLENTGSDPRILVYNNTNDTEKLYPSLPVVDDAPDVEELNILIYNPDNRMFKIEIPPYPKLRKLSVITDSVANAIKVSFTGVYPELMSVVVGNITLANFPDARLLPSIRTMFPVIIVDNQESPVPMIQS